MTFRIGIVDNVRYLVQRGVPPSRFASPVLLVAIHEWHVAPGADTNMLGHQGIVLYHGTAEECIRVIEYYFVVCPGRAQEMLIVPQ